MENSTLEEVVKEQFDKICSKMGMNNPYEIALTNDLPEDVHIIVRAGNPPSVIVNRIFVLMELLDAEKAKYRRLRMINLRLSLERAAEKVPRMTRNLANLIPHDMALILRRDAKRWIRTTAPYLFSTLPDRCFEIEYSVTVKETITNSSITLKGSDVKLLLNEAKTRLSRIVIDNEETMELFESLNNNISESKPAQINISVNNQEIKESNQY